MSYADQSWNDGVGECDEFVNDAAVTAGGLNIPYSTWVPTTWGYLQNAQVPFDEYSPSSTSLKGACAGDLVIYSNATGSSFCTTSSQSESNCGHIGIVTVGGSNAGDILADFHNNPHYHLAIANILGTTDVNAYDDDGYSTFRLYHLSHCASFEAPAPPPPAAPKPQCTKDSECSGGASGTERVCSNSGSTAGKCVTGCHGDSDCPGGDVCDTSGSHWTCAASPAPQATGGAADAGTDGAGEDAAASALATADASSGGDGASAYDGSDGFDSGDAAQGSTQGSTQGATQGSTQGSTQGATQDSVQGSTQGSTQGPRRGPRRGPPRARRRARPRAATRARRRARTRDQRRAATRAKRRAMPDADTRGTTPRGAASTTSSWPESRAHADSTKTSASFTRPVSARARPRRSGRARR